MSDGKWAARRDDKHFCPQHTGGNIFAPLEPTVLIGGQWAARMTDQALCTGGPLDTIGTGAFTTLIGGLPAARQTDQTLHGGKVATGLPTVLIGDTPVGINVIRRGNIFIIVNVNTKKIYMVGVQEFSGTGATQGYAEAAARSINATWSGPTTFQGQDYMVDCMVKGRVHGADAPANPMANQINVVQTNVPPHVHKDKDPANQPLYGRGTGYQHSNEDDEGTLTVPHEFGHSMGLDDEYTEGPRNKDGTRNIKRTGPPGGLMGDIDSGSKPTPDNFNSLITGNGLAP
jgi:uncharacterized Zn-binding protein involved in type VI secretion